MTQLTIRQRAPQPDGSNACLVFDHGEEYPITVSDPFDEGQEERLEWYFEQHLRFPFTRQVDAQQAAASITAYGEALFEQVFAERQAYARYQQALQAGLETLSIEIAGAPEFHALHWEALKDPDLPQPLALQAPVVRRNLAPQTVRAGVRPSPTVNLLVVTARPGGREDVGYRTISRPLVEALRQADTPVRVDVLRPGTYPALVDHLERVQDTHGSGYYHVIHFDVHGALLSYDEFQAGAQAERLLFQARYGRADVAPYDGQRAYLFLETEQEGQSDPVAAQELADLLIAHQTPIAILNACQSGKQVGDSETSLGSRLMQAGVQTVLAMGYSVTVSAARLLMTTLYQELFAGQPLPAAIRRGRLELHQRKGRRAYFDQSIDLEDWLLPVVYQNQPPRLQPRDFTDQERAAYYARQARRYKPTAQPRYGFVGRDLDVLQVEKRLLTRRNLLLIRGMGGAGKTTLLHHLGQWWQTTGFVERVFYFGYDARAWTRQQLMAAVARELLGEAEYIRVFQSLGLAEQQAFLAQRLRAARHLLILDNLESITGRHMAIQNTLPPEQQARLHDLLAELAGGRTLVLLGSRGGEEWLARDTFADNVYDLPGLDPEAASTLADRILERHGATRYREDADLLHLLKLLDGYPLPLEVVLANLARQTPAQVLAALQAGDSAIDMRDAQAAQDKTRSILRCIEYSHANLSPAAQALLACLAPFTSVLFLNALEQYTAQLQQQPVLADLPFERWEAVLQEAANWGLLSPHPQARGYLRLQPILPYFLRARLAAPAQAQRKAAVETAFRQLYDQFGGEIAGRLMSKQAQEKQLGQALAHLEYENLVTAVNLALEAKEAFFNAYEALFRYLRAQQQHQRAIELSETVLAAQQDYPTDKLTGDIGRDFHLVLDRLAVSNLEIQQYEQARNAYERSLELTAGLQGISEKTRGNYLASTYHQLGRVAQAQRGWAQAERYYQQALEIKIAFDDRYAQAGTYHQLGRVAEEQRGWAQAERYYQQALEIYIAFDDRYHQGLVYHQLGRVAQAQRGWAQAERYYQQALEIKIAFDDRYAQASTYHQLGIVAQEQRGWAQAERYYQQALEICIAFDDRHPQATVYHQLGMVAQEQRQWAQAERYYQQALEIKIAFDDRYAQAGTYHQLGRVAEEQRQWAQARDYFLKALETYKAYEDSHYLQIVLRSLARLWRASEDATLPAAIAPILGATPQEVEALLTDLSQDADDD